MAKIIKAKTNLVPCQTCNPKGKEYGKENCKARCKLGWVDKRLL